MRWLEVASPLFMQALWAVPLRPPLLCLTRFSIAPGGVPPRLLKTRLAFIRRGPCPTFFAHQVLAALPSLCHVSLRTFLFAAPASQHVARVRASAAVPG